MMQKSSSKGGNLSKIRTEKIETLQNQRIRMHRQLIAIELVVCIASAPLWLSIALIAGGLGPLIMVGIVLALLPIFGILYWISGHNQVTFSIHLNLMIVFGAITAIYFVLDADHTGILYLFCSVIALALISFKAGLVFTVLGAIVTAFVVLWRSNQFFVLQSGPAQVQDSLSIWINLALTETIIVVLFTVLVFMFNNMQRANQLSWERGQRLEQALADLELRQARGTTASEQVLSNASELSATSTLLAVGSTQQAMSLSEVSSTLTELNQTAGQITISAERVSGRARMMLDSAQQVQNTTSQAESSGVKGQQIIRESISSVSEVGQLYQNLVETLVLLSGNAKNIRQILALTKSLADETHLLSLNAAIEAAGAGQYGERFAVVAQEIKGLAGRSLNAGKEVGEIVSRIESALDQTMQVAQTGQTRVGQAIEMVQQSGQVIATLAQVTHRAAQETSQIALFAGEVKGMAEEIGVITRHQQNAGRQVLEALAGINLAANQTSISSSQLSQTAHELEALSQDLKSVLAFTA